MTSEHSSLKVLWARKRVVIPWLTALSIVVMIIWHDQIVGSLRSMKRRAEVRRVMNTRGRESGYRYQIRGPLTLAQVERELFGAPLDANSVTETPANADSATATWERMMRAQYQQGDEFYFATSDARSWAQLAGWKGYVLVRKKKVVRTFTTFLN